MTFEEFFEEGGRTKEICFKASEARSKNFWSSECHHACMIGRVVTKVNEVKQEICFEYKWFDNEYCI